MLIVLKIMRVQLGVIHHLGRVVGVMVVYFKNELIIVKKEAKLLGKRPVHPEPEEEAAL